MKDILSWSMLTFLFFSTSTSMAKGRLSEILEMAAKNGEACEMVLESAFESLKPAFQIKGARIQLQAVDASDDATVARAIEVYTNPKVMQMSGDFLDANSVRQIQFMGRSSPSELTMNSMVNFAVSTLNPVTGNRIIIGFAQLAHTPVEGAQGKGLVKNLKNWFEISYHIDPIFWGQGYASEIARTLIEHAMTKENAEGVYAQTILKNDGSGSVLKKAGLVEIDRVQFASLSPEPEGTIHYAITRAQWNKTTDNSGAHFYTEIIDGQEMIVMRIVGQVPTYSVVEVNAGTNEKNQSLPKMGQDRFVQLTETSQENEYHGKYLSVPRFNYMGGTIFTSILELDRLVASADKEGAANRLRYLRIVLESRLALGNEGAELAEELAAQIPENFLTMTIFEKKRVYEQMAKTAAAFKGNMQFLPFVLKILNSSGADILTREQIAPLKNK